MQYIGSNIRFIFTKIKELLNSHNTNSSAHSELFNSWTLLRDPTNAEIADALAVTHKNGIGDVLVQVANTQTFALEDMKLFFRPARLQLISANESNYEGIYITMDGTQGRYVAKTFADSEIMTPEGPSTISTPSELALYPAASDAVLYTPQTLTEEQKSQARTNIGALDENIHTTEVDVKRTLNGIGTNLFYVRKGWLKPCPDDANDELINSYTTAVLFLNFISSTVDSVKRHAKGAYTIYQQGLASANLQFTDNPLDVERYISWDITTNNNKTYLTYHHYGHNGFSETCRYCVEDDSYDNVRVVNALNTRQTGDNPNATVNQFYLATNPTKDMHVATKQYVDIAKTEAQQLGLTTATPGKTIKVKTVQDGKPTEWEVANIYEKPTSGIPKSDLEQSVQTSLAKADTSISYDSQTLTEEQKSQARTNIGAGQPVFVVNVTEVSGGYTADKTAAEIEAAYQAGRTIVCKTQARFVIGYIPVELPLMSRTQERVFIFATEQLIGSGIFTITVNISDSKVEVSSGMVGIYEKPADGIPKTDLEQSVQTSLAKADTSISYDSQTLTDAQKQQARQNIGAGQSDWNQNDETAADYVKNRPFYTGNPVETVLVEESTVSFSFSEDPGGYMAELTSTFEATVGETYKVYWDGAAYECTCVNVNNMPAIGNLSIVGGGSDTGEPFVMAVSNGQGIAIVTQNTSASHTFSISGFTQEVVKIDAKYLPDTVATKSEVEAAQTTANAAQTTANAALPKTGGTMSGNLTIDTENDSYQTIISPGEMALQYVTSPGDVNDELVISGRNAPRIVAREDGDSGFKLSVMGLSLGCTSTTKDGIHLRHSNGSSSPGEIVIQHTNLNNHAKERISIASTGEIECNNRLKFNCGSEIEVVQTYGKTGGSAIILHSSTLNSTKKFKITVDDSGVPTITDESDSTNTWKPTNLPTVTSSDSGKFLRVSDTGEWVAETILSATVSNNTLIIR